MHRTVPASPPHLPGERTEPLLCGEEHRLLRAPGVLGVLLPGWHGCLLKVPAPSPAGEQQLLQVRVKPRPAPRALHQGSEGKQPWVQTALLELALLRLQDYLTPFSFL